MRSEAAGRRNRVIISAGDPNQPFRVKSYMARMAQRRTKNSACLALIASFFFASGACAQSHSSEIQPSSDQRNIGDSETNLPVPTDRADMVTKIEILVELVKYDDQYYRYHLTDGGVEYHKISAFRIVEPAEFSGKILNIRHKDSPSPDSIWRTEGAVLRLRLLKSDVEFIADAIGSLGIQLVEVVEPR